MINKSDLSPQQKPVNVLTKYWSSDVTKIYNRFRVNVLIKFAFHKAIKFMNQLFDYQVSKAVEYYRGYERRLFSDTNIVRHYYKLTIILVTEK
jgi:hypothetical protein